MAITLTSRLTAGPPIIRARLHASTPSQAPALTGPDAMTSIAGQLMIRSMKCLAFLGVGAGKWTRQHPSRVDSRFMTEVKALLVHR